MYFEMSVAPNDAGGYAEQKGHFGAVVAHPPRQQPQRGVQGARLWCRMVIDGVYSSEGCPEYDTCQRPCGTFLLRKDIVSRRSRWREGAVLARLYEAARRQALFTVHAHQSTIRCNDTHLTEPYHTCCRLI